MEPPKSLRIAMIVPPWFEVPPLGYGGIEAMAAELVLGLQALGHDVTLIGVGHTALPVRHLTTYKEALPERIGEVLPEIVHSVEAARLLAELEVDVVHDHTFSGPLGAGARSAPTVITAHGPVDDEMGRYYAGLGESVAVVALSEFQRRAAPEINWVGRVPNALAVETFPFRQVKEDWVLWLGRFNEDKAAHLAIEVANAAGRRIVLAGKLSEDHERAYFNEYVKPLLGDGAEYVGEADGETKRELLASAACLVFPLQWAEPFGMVLIEAMACGTPVVTLNRGAIPEIVVDGLTGFVRREVYELADAISQIDRIEPAACRAHVAGAFDVPVMAKGYERVYRSVISAAKG